jgi:3-deoxy-D-manno-octulosonic-acid transferase
VFTNPYSMAKSLSWPERAALGIYSCLVWVVQPLVRRKLARRAKLEPTYGSLLEERFGRYDDRPGTGWIWVHAVSLGEARAAALLIAQLRIQHPDLRLLLTHSTATGWEAGTALLKAGDRQAWLPWDTRRATRQFLAHFRPHLGVLIETEVWPNLVQSCVAYAVPLVLVNARLNEASFAYAQRLRWLSGPAYRSLSAVYVQSPADSERLSELGTDVRGILGNIKFDAEPLPSQLLNGQAWRRLSHRSILALVSSREGEEAALVASLSSGVAGDTQILVVPRHPQRVDAVADLFLAAGFSVSRRSQWQDHPQPADVWLGDTMGEIALYYALADVALLGGSFGRFGGQNLIEAAACRCPLVMGPHTYNFSQAAQWAEQSGAARTVASMDDGVQAAIDWIDRPQELLQAQVACDTFARMHQGASQKTAAALLTFLQRPQKTHSGAELTSTTAH